jgi:hypothetical protein
LQAPELGVQLVVFLPLIRSEVGARAYLFKCLSIDSVEIT